MGYQRCVRNEKKKGSREGLTVGDFLAGWTSGIHSCSPPGPQSRLSRSILHRGSKQQPKGAQGLLQRPRTAIYWASWRSMESTQSGVRYDVAMGCERGTYNIGGSGVSRWVGNVSKLVRGRTSGSGDGDGRECGRAEEGEQHRVCRERRCEKKKGSRPRLLFTPPKKSRRDACFFPCRSVSIGAVDLLSDDAVQEWDRRELMRLNAAQRLKQTKQRERDLSLQNKGSQQRPGTVDGWDSPGTQDVLATLTRRAVYRRALGAMRSRWGGTSINETLVESEIASERPYYSSRRPPIVRENNGGFLQRWTGTNCAQNDFIPYVTRFQLPVPAQKRQ
jgi:hypothetical protein